MILINTFYNIDETKYYKIKYNLNFNKLEQK